MNKSLFLAAIAAVTLSACAETATTTSSEVDPLIAALSGKTLVTGDAMFKVGKNGSLTGKTGDGTKYVGAWEVRNGKWCNAFSEPAGLEKTVCQKAVLEDDGTVTIDSRRGGSLNWKVQ